MPGGSFQVDPEALRRLATDFDATSSQVPGLVAAFTAPAQDIQDAFGLLGPSDTCYNNYQHAVTEALTGLNRLTTALEQVARALRTSADNYAGSDNASAPGGGQ